MGKTLRRYVLTEIAGYFLAGVAALTFLFFVGRVLDLADMVLARGVPGSLVGRLFLYILPSFLELTFPMATLLAVIVALGRLSSDGELIAMRAAGIDVGQLLGPALGFALIVAIGASCLAVWVRPVGHREVKATLYEIARTRATAALRPNFFHSDFDGLVLYIARIDPRTGDLGGVLVSDERDSSRHVTTMARSGKIVGNAEERRIFLQLEQGTSVGLEANQNSYDWTDFDTLEVHLDLDPRVQEVATADIEPREMTWEQLVGSRNRRLAAGESATDENIEIHRKFSLSMASIVLAMVAVPLGMQQTRTRRSRGLGVTCGVLLVYYVLLSAAEASARRELIAPALAMWTPNLLTAGAGIFLALRLTREIRLPGTPESGPPGADEGEQDRGDNARRDNARTASGARTGSGNERADG